MIFATATDVKTGPRPIGRLIEKHIKKLTREHDFSLFSPIIYHHYKRPTLICTGLQAGLGLLLSRYYNLFLTAEIALMAANPELFIGANDDFER